MSGSVYEAHFYQIEENGMIDYDKLLAKAKQVQPKMIVVGASAYPRTIDFKI